MSQTAGLQGTEQMRLKSFPQCPFSQVVVVQDTQVKLVRPIARRRDIHLFTRPAGSHDSVVQAFALRSPFVLDPVDRLLPFHVRQPGVPPQSACRSLQAQSC